MIKKDIQKLLANNEQGIKLDIACGASKQPGFVGLDMQDLPGVDIVWDLTRFSWPLPDECASLAVGSHIVEHIPPDMGDARVEPLINLLLKKKLITEKEVKENIGEIKSSPRFLRFMDEVWRVLKPDGEFMMVFPYGGSTGYWQDPTHVNGINEYTFEYFDPLGPQTNGIYYSFYRPLPWKIKINMWDLGGNMEVVLIKRRIDKSYKVNPQALEHAKNL